LERLHVRRPGFRFDWVSPALGDHDTIPAAEVASIGHRDLGPQAQGWMQVPSETLEEQRVCAVSNRMARRIRSSREFQANHCKQDREMANAQLRDESALDPAYLRG
jgi:hypothetical protein